MNDRLPPYHGEPSVRVCADVRESINSALKMLCRKRVLKGKDPVDPSIVDGLVDDIERMRLAADEMRQKAQDPDCPKPDIYVMMAVRYDQVIMDAQLKLMELGVKAANNEQMAIDRQVLTREKIASDERRSLIHAEAQADKATTSVDKVEAVRERLRLMQSKAIEAQFEPRAP